MVQINRMTLLSATCAALFLLQPGLDAVAQTWMHYGGDEGGSRFSALDQINRDNVDGLELAWRVGDAPPGEGVLKRWRHALVHQAALQMRDRRSGRGPTLDS